MGTKVPASLINIYKELSEDIENFQIPKHGCLLPWAEQGVLLLNTCLTVQAHQPKSHSGKGWEVFTDVIIRKISQEKKKVVFLLWGRDAQSKSQLVDKSKHHILTAAHPSPYSVQNFFHCRHFSKTNDFLIADGIDPINWHLPLD